MWIMLLFPEGFEDNLHAETCYIAGTIFVILFKLRSIAPSLREEHGRRPHSSIKSLVTLYLASIEQMLCLSIRYMCQPLIYATCNGTVLRKSKCMYSSFIVLEGMYVPVLLIPCSIPENKLSVVQSFISRPRGAEDAVSL